MCCLLLTWFLEVLFIALIEMLSPLRPDRTVLKGYALIWGVM